MQFYACWNLRLKNPFRYTWVIENTDKIEGPNFYSIFHVICVKKKNKTRKGNPMELKQQQQQQQQQQEQKQN